jgi:hypothetical protein
LDALNPPTYDAKLIQPALGPVAHRMARDVGATGIGIERFRRVIENLHGVEPAPLFPVEPVGPAVGGRHDVCPRLGREAIRLTDRLDAGAVQRQDQAGFRALALQLGGDERVILYAAVEVAAEGDLARLAGLEHAELDLDRVERLRILVVLIE